MKSIIDNEFNEHLKITKATMENIGLDIEATAKICIDCLKNGGKILLFGKHQL